MSLNKGKKTVFQILDVFFLQNSGNILFCFFSFFRKKKQSFFLPRKCLQDTHSPKKMISPKKRSKTGKKNSFSNFGGVLFFPKKSENISFFFPEKFTLHSLTHFQKAKKKQHWKKKHNFHSPARF